MNKELFKVVSKMILSVARKSSVNLCTWRFYQPKVPKKLIDND